MQGWEKYPEKKAVLLAGGVLTQRILDSFEEGALVRWKTEILNRLIPETRLEVMACKALHGETATAYDKAQWKKVQEVRENWRRIRPVHLACSRKSARPWKPAIMTRRRTNSWKCSGSGTK